MSGYCPNCGNTLCICNLISDNQAQKPLISDATIDAAMAALKPKPDAPAREWWIFYVEGNFESLYDKDEELPSLDGPDEELIHVIEKSHADALTKRVEHFETLSRRQLTEIAAAKARYDERSNSIVLLEEALISANQRIKELEDERAFLIKRHDIDSRAIKGSAAIKEREAKLVAALTLIETGKYQNGEHMDREGMRSLACNILAGGDL